MHTIREKPANRWMNNGLVLAGNITVSFLFTLPVQAEWNIGGYGGIANSGAFSNATVSDPILGGGVTNASLNDLELKSTLFGGAKGAYFFESRPRLGLETDVYTLKPDVKQQTVVGGTTTGRVFADNIGPIPLRLTTWAVNIIIRSIHGGFFQPYGGMGYGLFFATVQRRANRTPISARNLTSSQV